MLNIITNDKSLDHVIAEVTREIKDADSLEGSYRVERTEEGLYIKDGVIGYSDLRSLARAVSIIAQKRGERSIDVRERPRYGTLGAMPDASRNAVPTVENAKKLCRILALEGFNALMLYTEDTYEIEGYPYFGHLRGRYSAEELREIDDYAASLGIEVIPCIQVLAHLNAMFEWPAHAHLRDCADIMLVGDEAVYELIDAMLGAMSKNLRSRRINLGLDEAFMLGRGEYISKNGYAERSDIMKAHLARVMELCRKYGYTPRMWSDMFFVMANNGEYRVMGIDLPQDIIDSVPKDLVLIYWDYIQNKSERYSEMLRQHGAFKNKTAFAGSVCSWYGLVPMNRLARNSTLAAFDAIEKSECDEIYATMWGDDGGLCSAFSTLTTLFIYGEACWADAASSDTRSRERLESVLGIDAQAMLALEDINALPGRELVGVRPMCAAKYMFWQNSLMGKFDRHVPDGSNEHFARQTEILKGVADRAGQWAYIYESLWRLCYCLSIKAELGKRIYAAYHSADRDTLEYIRKNDIPELRVRVEELRKAVRRQWHKENKPFGLDVFDIRIGGLDGHLKAVEETLAAWLDGDIERIEELEAPRLDFCEKNDNGIIEVSRWHQMAGQNLF